MSSPSSSAAPQAMSEANATDKKPTRRPRSKKKPAKPPSPEAPPAASTNATTSKNSEPPTPALQAAFTATASDSKEEKKKRQRKRPNRNSRGEKKPATTLNKESATQKGSAGLEKEPQQQPTSSVTRSDKGKKAEPKPSPQQKKKERQPKTAVMNKKPQEDTYKGKGKDTSSKAALSEPQNKKKKQKYDGKSPSTATGPKAKEEVTQQKTSSITKNNNTSKVDKPKKQTKKTKKKAYYEEHLSPQALAEGLSTGALLQAQLRVNGSDRTQGFITIPGLPNDIFIKGIKAQNRAIEGDRVVIKVNPPHLWHQQKKVANGVSPCLGFAASSGGNGIASHHHSELLATPALVHSASGGELDFDLESVPSSSSRCSSPSFSDFLGGDVANGMEQPKEEEEEKKGGGATIDSVKAATKKMEGLTLIAEGDADEGLAISMVDFIEQEVIVPKIEEKKKEKEKGRNEVRGGATIPPPVIWHGAHGTDATVRAIASSIEQYAGWRATAEVVGILEFSKRRNTIIGVLKSGTIITPSDNNNNGNGNKSRDSANTNQKKKNQKNGDNNNNGKDSKTKQDDNSSHLNFIPTDLRLPSMLVRPEDIAKECRQKLIKEANNPEMVTRTLVMAHIDRWNATTPHPFVTVDGEIGEAGSLQAETRALLEQEGIVDDDAFNEAILSCLPPTPWSISSEDLKGRRDFRNQRVFSIDPPTARDLDDALSIERLGSTCRYRVGVHIADVSHFVKAGTALDAEAGERSTSVYLVDRVIPMLPRLLCEELCSLNPGVDRLAFSIVWELDEQGTVVGEIWAGRSVIRSCGKLAYPMVQTMIDGEYSAKPGEEPPCELHGDFKWTDVYEDCMALYKISRNLRKRRFDNGALRLDNARLYYELDDGGRPIDCGVYVQKEANQLVEEFMLLANMTAANMVSESYPDRALLRCHPPPNGEKMAELTMTSQMHLGIFLDTSSSKALHKSLEALRNHPNADRGAVDVITMMATKPMQLAKYFCTAEADNANWRHYALATDRYTHFTSPIRRYPDIIVHRLLAATLEEKYGGGNNNNNNKEKRSLLIEKYGLAPHEKVTDISNHANDRKLAAKSAQDNSLRLYLAIMLFDRPRVVDAVVMALNGSRFLDLYVPSLGIDVRVQTAEILKGGGDAIVTTWDSAKKELIIQRDEGKVGKMPELGIVDYSCVNNMDKLQFGGGGEAKQQLPLTLRLLTHVPLVLTSQRSKTSGSPSRIFARFWLE